MSRVVKRFTDSQSISANTNLASHSTIRATEYSIQLNVSSACALCAEFKVQVSNDNVNYVDLTGSALAITANTNHLLEVTEVSYEYIRIAYTRTAGSMTAESLVTIRE